MIINAITKFIEDKTGLYFKDYKKEYLIKGIQKRMKKIGVKTYKDYYGILLDSTKGDREINELANLITIWETCFFRHFEQFLILRDKIIPEIVEKKRKNKVIKIWSAGCSTGEEAYSIAIIIKEISHLLSDFNIEIIGTDISLKALEIAKKAKYSGKSISTIPKEYLKYFLKKNNSLILKDEIKEMVKFFQFNLIKEPFPLYQFYGQDIIFCRNVFIYFQPSSIKRVARNFFLSLNEGGYLILSPTESLWGLNEDFTLTKYDDVFLYKKEEKIPPKIREKIPEIEKIAEESEEIKPYLLKMKLYGDRGLYKIAEETAKFVLKLKPTKAEIYLLLAIFHYEQGEAEKAKEALKKAIYLEPNFALAYFYLGNIYLSEGELKKAKNAYKNVISSIEKGAYWGILPEIMDIISEDQLLEISSTNYKSL